MKKPFFPHLQLVVPQPFKLRFPRTKVMFADMIEGVKSLFSAFFFGMLTIIAIAGSILLVDLSLKAGEESYNWSTPAGGLLCAIIARFLAIEVGRMLKDFKRNFRLGSNDRHFE